MYDTKYIINGVVMYMVSRQIFVSPIAKYIVFIIGPIIIPCIAYKKNEILVNCGVALSIFFLNSSDTVYSTAVIFIIQQLKSNKCIKEVFSFILITSS